MGFRNLQEKLENCSTRDTSLRDLCNDFAYKTGWVKKDSSFQKAKEAIEFCVSVGIAVTIGQKLLTFFQALSDTQIVISPVVGLKDLVKVSLFCANTVLKMNEL